MEKENKSNLCPGFEETDMICPDCGGKIYKHFHKEITRNTVKWKRYICQNLCDLDCHNCGNTNSHGECNLEYCYAISGWIPEER